MFQFFQLLPTLTALENAMLPLDFARRVPRRDRRGIAAHNLELVGLVEKLDHLPSELSGGEQQRVAIARALASDPKLIIGDEPTGNLDTQTAAEMFELLQRLNNEGKTVLYVTHDLELAARAGHVVTIRDGLVVVSEEADMASTLLKKSITDLTRRKARAAFAVLTLAIAVASVGIFAASPLISRAMQGEVRASRLADLTLQTKPLVVTAAQLAALGRLPNVEGVRR